MHFTKSQIEEIRQRLALQTKKDSEFPDAEIPLDGSERLPVIQYIPLVQDWENRLLSFADMRRMVLSNIDMELVSCVLTVNCETTGATITIRSNRGQVSGSTSVTYNSFYGEVVTVTVEADGYDMWYESVTMTQDHTLDISLNLSISAELLNAIATLQEDVAGLKGDVEDLDSAVGRVENKVDAISLVNNGDYYTLTVGDTSVDFYSKPQVDSLLAGQGSGGATGDNPFVEFSTKYVTLNSAGRLVSPAEGVMVYSSISWTLENKPLADEQYDDQHQEETTAPDTMSMNIPRGGSDTINPD